MLLVQGNTSQNYGFLCVPIGCVRFACTAVQMYSRHLFLYGGLQLSEATQRTNDNLARDQVAIGLHLIGLVRVGLGSFKPITFRHKAKVQ